SRRYLAALGFLWGVFVFFTIYQFLPKSTAVADSKRLEELKNISLPVNKLSGKDWPQWRGPNRDGLSTETGLLTSWPEAGPRKLWEQPTGEGYSSMAVARGRVFSMVQDKDQEAIVCWDAESG